MGAVVRAVLTSPEFESTSSYYARYSWPVEFVVRAIKEVGWVGFSVNDTLTPLENMGQQLYEPPDVNGWEPGKGWFSTAGSLARMNFASTLATNQRFALRDDARIANKTPESVVSWALLRLTPAPMERGPVANSRELRERGHLELDRVGRAAPLEGSRARAPDRGLVGIPARLGDRANHAGHTTTIRPRRRGCLHGGRRGT